MNISDTTSIDNEPVNNKLRKTEIYFQEKSQEHRSKILLTNMKKT